MCLGPLREVRATGVEHPLRSIRGHQPETVRGLLIPVQSSLGAVDPEAEVITLAHGDLRGKEDTPRATHEVEEQRGIVLQGPARYQGPEVGKEALHLEPRDVPGQVVGMGPDVPQSRGDASPGRIEPPLGLLVPLRLQEGGEPPLGVLHDHFANRPQGSGSYPLPRLLHHRIPSVVVRHGEDSVSVGSQATEGLGILQGGGQGFVAHHVETGVQECTGHRKVEVVGGHDRDDLDAIVGGKGGLGPHHLVVGGVRACGIKAELATSPSRALLVGRERPRNQGELAVQGRRHPVDGPDEGVGAPAHHTVPDGRHAPIRSTTYPPARRSRAYSVPKISMSTPHRGTTYRKEMRPP